MELRPGYKQTEVGIIPEEWNAVPMEAITTHIGDGLHGTPVYSSNGEYFFINGNNLHDGKIVVTSETKAVAHSEFVKYRKSLSDRSILMSINGTIGNLALFDGEAVVLGKSAAYVNVKKEVSKPFVYHALQTEIVKRQLLDGLTGSTIGNLGLTTIRSARIPLPPTEAEQRAIAEALGDAHALMGALDRLIGKKRELKQASMQQLLTGQTRLPGFGPTVKFKQHIYGSIPDDWNVKPLKLVSTMSGRIGWQGLQQGEFTENPDDPFLITGMNFKDGKIRWDEVYHIPTKRYLEAPPIQLRLNDILMTKDGTIGKLLYVDVIPYPGKASLNSHLLVFRPIGGQYEPKFLFYQLGSPAFAQHVELHKSGSTFYGLTQDATGKYPVVLPSVSEQTAIAEVLAEMDAELASLEQRREKTRALKQGMMQELLTGRTRLVSPKESHA